MQKKGNPKTSIAFTQSLRIAQNSLFEKLERKNSCLDACKPNVPPIVMTMQTKNANENVITRFHMYSEEPAIEPAVHIPAIASKIMVEKIRIFPPIFLDDFVSIDFPKKNNIALNVKTAQEAIKSPAHIKKAAWQLSSPGDSLRCSTEVEFIFGGSGQSINS